MKIIRDPNSGWVLFYCPECGTLLVFANEERLHVLRRAGKCEGCVTFDAYLRRPFIIEKAEEHFRKLGLPEGWR